MNAYPLLIVAFFFGLASAQAKPFPLINGIEGVVKVDYDAPNFWVVIEKNAHKQRIAEQVERIRASDPDAKQIAEGYQLYVLDRAGYRNAVRQLKLYRSANSAPKLLRLAKQAYFCSLYDLDWKLDKRIRQRHQLFQRPSPPFDELRRQEDRTVKSDLLKYERSRREPDQLLCLVLPSIGVTVYPVSKGMIEAQGKTFRFDPQAFGFSLNR